MTSRDMDTANPEKLVIQLIRWMRDESVAPTRTRLVKFLYLADLLWARYRGGATFTHWPWYVHTFGPMANEALQLLDEGVSDGWLRQTSLGGDDDDEVDDPQRTTLYDLTQPTLDEQALPAEFGKLRVWIKRYGDSTARLLRFVYGDTEPMENVAEGELLDFTRARDPRPQSAKTTEPLSRSARKQMDELMARIRHDYQRGRLAAEAAVDGPRDSVYRDGIPDDDSELPSQPVQLLFGKG